LKVQIISQIEGFSFMEEKALNLKKMLTIFLKMIGSGLSIGNKKETQSFQKLFLGQVRNEYVQEINGFKVISLLKNPF